MLRQKTREELLKIGDRLRISHDFPDLSYLLEGEDDQNVCDYRNGCRDGIGGNVGWISSLSCGSGGRIRTADLRIMSRPTAPLPLMPHRCKDSQEACWTRVSSEFFLFDCCTPLQKQYSRYNPN
jgi:hypothetical protein